MIHAHHGIPMSKITLKPGDRPVLLDLWAFSGETIPIRPVTLESEAQASALLQNPDDGALDLVWSTHAATGETLISLAVKAPDPAGPAILLTGHDRPIFSPAILIGGTGSKTTSQLVDRVAFLIGDELMTSSIFKGKRRWRPQPAFKYGSDAFDILEFLNSNQD
jgi:hypothetical protein